MRKLLAEHEDRMLCGRDCDRRQRWWSMDSDW